MPAAALAGSALRDGLAPLTPVFVPRSAASHVTAQRAEPLRLLLLFEKEWDSGGFAPLERAGELKVFSEGFDLFRFPSNARLMTFNVERWVDKLVHRYRGRVDAVISSDEQFGCLLAAVVAQRLGLPGNDPAAIARAQHKLLLRQVVARAVPEATVAAAALPFSLSDRRVRDPRLLAHALAEIGFGDRALFVKPIKATFSVLARRVAHAGELSRHLHFSAFERLVIDRLVAPYARLASRHAELPCHPTRMMVEEALDGHQVNVDGYAFEGEPHIIGIIDEWMYPREAEGARHFLRFAYPSHLDPAMHSRIEDVVKRVMRAIGFRNGFFNCELFVMADGSLRVIEVNPRLAVQFVAAYRDVDGLDIFRMLVALARGQDPAGVPRLEPRGGAAASFVFRRFDGNGARPPTAGAEQWLAEHYPHAELTQYHKRGVGLAREYKWLGSHRYALLNLSSQDQASLHADFERICERLGWPCEI